MVMWQDLRRIRLKNDYQQMCNIQGRVISWKPLKGAPPYVEQYEVTINVRTIVGVGNGGPIYRDQSVVILTLPPGYPKQPPKSVMVSLPRPFHPNWYSTSGIWDCGLWSFSEALGEHVVRLVKTLQFDLDYINENSPSNMEASSWYEANKDSGLFPCDRTKLLNPSTPYL